MRALIVVDMQNDFAAAGGTLTTKEAINIVHNVYELVNEFLENGDAIYFTRDTHDEGYRWTQEGMKLPVEHCRYGTWGWQIVNGLDVKETPHNNVKHLNKHQFAYDAWEDEDLGQYDEIVVCGVVSSICCISNCLVIKSIYPELPIKFAAYASAGLNPTNHANAIDVMRSCQIEVLW